MRKSLQLFPPVFVSLLCLGFFFGCLASPVDRAGGPGSITIKNTNPSAIRDAAIPAFARSGYTLSRSSFPQSLSFDRPAGRTGELMFGSFGQTTTIRVRLQLVPLVGTDDIRIMTQVYRVNNAGVAGFERDTAMMRSWAAQFKPILRQIQSEAANAGPGPGF